MKKRMRKTARTVSFIVCMAMVASFLLTVNVYAAKEYESGSWYYMVENGEAIITEYEAADTTSTLVVPETLGGYPVTGISGDGYGFSEVLEYLVIPATVRNISTFAFHSLGGPRRIDVAEENPYLSSIEGVLFNREKTELLICPDGSRFSEYVIPDSVTTIGEYAFKSCDTITSVTIPDSVTSIESFAFACDGYYGNNQLTDVYYKGTKTQWDAIEIADGNGYLLNSNIHFLKEPETPEEITCFTYVLSDDKATITGYTGAETEFTTPTTLGGYPVTAIGEEAFSDNKNLTSVVISDGVTVIGNGAFNNCENLISVTIPEGVTTIGNYAFAFCNIKKIDIPNTVITIGGRAFADSGIQEIVIPDSVTTIGDSLFDFSALKKVTIGSGITDLSKICKAVRICGGLESINVSEDNPICSSIEGVLFSKDKTELILYPEGKQDEEYDIPRGVDTIASNSFYSFWGNENLKSVIIPSSVMSIGDCSFCSAANLTDVYYIGSEARWNQITIGANNEDLLNADIHFLEDPKGTLAIETKKEISTIKDGSSEAAAMLDEISAKIDAVAANETLSFEEVQKRIEALKKEAKMSCGVLNLRFQIAAGTDALSEKSDIRFISTVDSLNYKETGFYITINGVKKRLSTKYVYTDLISNSGSSVTNYAPSSIFKESKYFTTYSLWNIPNSAFTTPITVQAFVVTYNGEEIRGVEKTRTVSNFIIKGV